MTSSERFQSVMHFEKPDHVPYLEMKYYPQTVERWRREGLPADVTPAEYFGDDTRIRLEISYRPEPDPNSKVRILSRKGGRIVRENEIGLRTMTYENVPPPHMPHFLAYPVSSRDDFERIRNRFDPERRERLPTDWHDRVRKHSESGAILELCLGGLFWYLRGLMGPERALTAFYDDPDLVTEMLDCFANLAYWVADVGTRDVKVDYAVFLEDISYKNGPLISPDFFRRFMGEHYRRITELLHSRGVDLIFVDTDGNVDKLVPLYLEVGVNGILPMEVAAGSNPLEIHKRHDGRMRMLGGVDKRAIVSGKKAIEAQFAGVIREMLKRGGYIPHVDHAVAADLPFENYTHYRKLLSDEFAG